MKAVIRKAKQKLRKSDIRRHKVVAMAFSGQYMVAGAVNLAGSGKVSSFSFHAEELLINKLRKIKALERFGRISVLVMRLKKTGEWGMARPCRNCTRLMSNYGVSDVVYTDFDGSIRRMQ